MKSPNTHHQTILFFIVVLFTNSIMCVSQYRRMHIIFDKDQRTALENTNPGFNVSELTINLIEKASPILLRWDLLSEFISYKVDSYRILNQSGEKEKLLQQVASIIAENPSDINNYLEQKNINLANPVALIYNQLLLTASDWYLFDCPHTPFLLIIPKSYLKKILGSDDLSIVIAQQEKLGLRISSFMELELPSTNNYEDVVRTFFAIDMRNKKNQRSTLVFSADLKKVFLPAPGEQEEYYAWNIYFGGHGLYQPPHLAGLSVPIFQDVLRFFNTYIKTNFVYYITCYSGGKQLIDPFTPFTGPQKLQYPIASGSALLATVFHQWLMTTTYAIINGILTIKPNISFARFFESLESEEPFDKALFYVTDLSMTTNRFPLIRYPGIETFMPIRPSQKIMVITKVLDSVQAMRNKPFVVTDKAALLIYPQIVMSSLVLEQNKNLEIFFMSPEHSHYLSSLTVDNIADLLNRFLKQEVAEPLFIYLKELTITTKPPLTLRITGDNGAKKTVPQTWSLKNAALHISKSGVNLLIRDKLHGYVRLSMRSHEEFISKPVPADVVVRIKRRFKQFERMKKEEEMQLSKGPFSPTKGELVKK